LEQVQVRGIVCRSLRLELILGLGVALALPALAAENPQGLTTRTALSAEARLAGGPATVVITVTGEDGQPATGAVSIEDLGRPLAGVALDAQGKAKTVLSLGAGNHSLRALYEGDAAHQASASTAAAVTSEATAAFGYTVAVAPTTLSLVPGNAGTLTASVTPANAASLTAPVFVTLSCSGLPDEASCNFTPENVEILPGATSALTSTMVIETVKASTASLQPAGHPVANPISLAFLLPGALALVGFAVSGRRRRWLSRVALMGLLALVSVLGTTACNPRYNYLNHGPIPNPATPAGTYTVTIAAQSNNGITATQTTATVALTVQ
jgi:hypothetical protein